jgi:hypothetical protein
MDLFAELVVRVQWNSGHSQIIHTYPGSPIDETLAAHGFSTSPSSTLLVAFKGQFINPIFSFHYYNITNGDKLVCIAKKNRWSFHGIRYFVDRCLITPLSYSQICTMEEIRTDVLSKMVDRAFNKWELCEGFVSTMKDLLVEQERLEDDEFKGESVPTMVPQAASINDTPIPTIWSIHTPKFTDARA